jgi:DNA helicase-2/ATP-dependent DNA helicase PcrA
LASSLEVSVGSWAEPAGDSASNPRELDGRSMDWPLDPLGPQRAAIEEGAAMVVAAIGERVPGPPAGEEEAGWAAEVDLLLTERDAAAGARIAVQLPAHLSASRLVALAEDPQALAARLRRPMPEQPSPQARRGSEFHAWLERRFAAAALLDVEELPGASDAETAADAGAELAALQQTFLASEWAHRTAEAVEVAIETPVAGVVLRGRIDAIFPREGGGWDVVDWKTGPPPTGDHARAAAVQLAVYRLAWSRLTGTPLEQVGAAFFYASTGETVRPVDLLDQAALEDLLTLS